MSLPALDANHRHSQSLKTMVERRGHAAGLEHDPLTAWCPRQGLRNRLRQGRRHCLQRNVAVAIDNADVRLFHRDIQSSKVFHGCSPFALGSQLYRTPEEQPPHYPMLQKSPTSAVWSADLASEGWHRVPGRRCPRWEWRLLTLILS